MLKSTIYCPTAVWPPCIAVATATAAVAIAASAAAAIVAAANITSSTAAAAATYACATPLPPTTAVPAAGIEQACIRKRSAPAAKHTSTLLWLPSL